MIRYLPALAIVTSLSATPAMADPTYCRIAGIEARTMMIELDSQRHDPTYVVTTSMQKVFADYKQNCKRGDTMAVPMGIESIWQEQCDFKQTILRERGIVTCIRK